MSESYTAPTDGVGVLNKQQVQLTGFILVTWLPLLTFLPCWNFQTPLAKHLEGGWPEISEQR